MSSCPRSGAFNVTLADKPGTVGGRHDRGHVPRFGGTQARPVHRSIGMSELATHPPGHVPEGRRGREARRTARSQRSALSIPYINRNLPLTEVLSAEGLEIIENNAERLLAEVGIEFRDVPKALDLLKAAGCDVK